MKSANQQADLMNYQPQRIAPKWLTAKPIAHRGLHNETSGLVENCEASFAAALRLNFSIECDIELSADGQAMVFHDDDVDRLCDAKGAVKSFSKKHLQNLSYKQGKDRMQSLPELLEQVAGKETLVIEIKSLWDDDLTLTNRAIKDLTYYEGPVCLMSFDPFLIAHVAETAPMIIRGITADRVIDSYYDPLPAARRSEMATLSHLPQTKPDFISYDFSHLPYDAITSLRNAKMPIITWTIRNQTEAALALQNCDQITFEGFKP